MFRADPASAFHRKGFDPARRAILYCGGEPQSALAATLQEMGYNVVHLEGGISAWKEEGRLEHRRIAAGSHDLEGKTVGIYGAGQIGQRIAARLKPFDVKLLYYKRSRLGTVEELSLGIRYATLEEMTAECDVIVVAAPLTPETEGLFDRETLFNMKQGAYLVNIARGAIVETDALVEALEEGHLGGYAGDVWYPEPAPSDHPWSNMPRHAMTPHVSGTTLEAQKRYAAGVRDSLMRFLEGRPIRDDYVMVADGEIQSGSYRAIYGKANQLGGIV